MSRSLRRQLEAIRRALAGRPPDPPDPPGPSITEELSRPDPVRLASVIAVMARTSLLDRFCDEHDDGRVANDPLTQLAWTIDWGGKPAPWDFCATCSKELDRFDPESVTKPEPNFPEPELWVDEEFGEYWRARYCELHDRDRSMKPDGADDVWIEPEWKTENPWDACTTCGKELVPCEPATRD